jgi:hypothetical protein
VTSSASHAVAAGVDLAAEVERLRIVLEKLPACVMRVGTDGTLLAVNEAALSLLAARELAQVLDTNFAERLAGDAAATFWMAFVSRVFDGGSASAECNMIDLAGAEREVLVVGVRLPDHPDQRRSLLVTVRDTSAARRLEASLQEQDQLRQAAQHGLEAATASLQQLSTELQETASECEQLRAVIDGEVGRRQQLSVTLEQLTRALSVAVNAAALARQSLEKGNST